MSTRQALELSNLTVSYGRRRVVDVPELAVASGQLLGIIGSNGAGKSTLVNAVAGWSRAKPQVSGEVWLHGRKLDGLEAHERVRSGLLLVPEGKLVFTTMSVEENLAIGHSGTLCDGRRVWSTGEVYKLFPRLAERRHHLGSQLSGGERQMLGIAKSLRLGPSVLLLDEPSIGLAPQLVANILATLKTLAAEGLAVLLVEQNAKAAFAVVDRVVLLEHGRIAAEGPVANVRDDPRIAKAYLGVSK